LGVVRVHYATAAQAAAASSGELLDTYEAQVVRALGQIEQTLNLVKSWPRGAAGHPLADLKEKGLLPPDLLFVVTIADRRGNILDSTRAIDRHNIADQDYFRVQIDRDTLGVGQPPRGPTGDAPLQFSRRLIDANGDFDGIVAVWIDANYFVSGYDAAKLGQRGVLSLIGSDHVVKVMRSGESLSSGATIDYGGALQDPDALATSVPLSISSWDRVRRWTVARELYGFPLAVLVGLSSDEQMAPAHRLAGAYVRWAALASILAAMLIALLWRMSWRLEQSRLREAEAKVNHAQRVEYLAFHDALTGLPNRSLFSKLLAQSISEAARYDTRLAVAFLDLDRFKRINDTLGHEAGDRLLADVALRLKSCIRDSDTVARLGGDEFVVLLPQSSDADGAATVAQKILASLAAPFMLMGQELRVTASIGISSYPQDGLDEQTLTKNADIAMYQAKAEGRNNFQFYSEKLNANSLERLTLESSLRHALRRHELRLHYQAKRDIATGRITGMEALLRWEHPDLGMVAPMRFIPIAEETGLILPIGNWVIRSACAQNVAWQQQGLPALIIAVNLTERQFANERLLSDVLSILEDTGMDPHLLELEIPESMLIHQVVDTLQILTGLKAAGIRIAIDDFGVGFSSLATLQRFPLDTIKIARSLVGDLGGTAKDTELADAVIAMGKALSLTVVAQGVETREQADFLRQHACDELQGFYFNRPLDAAEFGRLLRVQATEITYIGERFGETPSSVAN
jgi:diguanylate cyclase (GGDEF)-like protein